LALVGRVLASIHQATANLTDADVERVIFYTLPDPPITPLGMVLSQIENRGEKAADAR